MYKHNDPCLEKVDEDEPIFVLRAQDKFAPEIVRAWAERVDVATKESKSVTGFEKVNGAYRIADMMEEWQRQTGRAKIPD